ncbi:MAG TPA: riboflavin synthase [Steroidobacteraceae bacterium]|jgi:riboflavin synthase
MFTGIVQAVGEVRTLTPRGGDVELLIAAGTLGLAGVAIGDSISVSGCCLTVTRLTADSFAADASLETLQVTTLGGWRAGQRVNLEKALRAGDALGGHYVSGHVDGVATVVASAADARSLRVDFEVPAPLARYIARKGSVCIDGVSLTVNDATQRRFGVNLIPHTLEVTTLGACRPGTQVNLEVDIIARYLERLSRAGDDA